MLNKIREYFDTCDFDIRKTKNARFFDQKVQPDVLSAVCECILNCTENNSAFTVNDIRYCPYSNELVTEIFNKPDIKKAENEYDKFFAQPLKMLAYSGLLKESKKGRTNEYSILNKNFIEYISLRDRNAYFFLSMYIEKVLRDSGIWEYFDTFFSTQTKESLYVLRGQYVGFIQQYTAIKKDFEPIRILNPLLRTLAFKLKKLGSKDGDVAEINYDDLLYNKPNWRDIKKDKAITRVEFNAAFQHNIDNGRFYEYQIEKAKKFVKALHKNSEIHDFDAYPATQAHHIFSKSEFPELADMPENIIALTPNQHFYRAHPDNKTSILDKTYQVICLISKLDSVEVDYQFGTNNYSKDSFIDVVNTGLGTSFNYTVDFEELKHSIVKFFL